MRKKIIVALKLFFLLLFLFFVAISFLWPKKAGIFISSEPQSIVFINGEEFGKTPVESLFDPGEVVVKIKPNDSEESFETRVNLVAGVKTIIQRQFDNQGEDSAGVLVTFEKQNPKRTTAFIASVPESAQVLIDGQLRGTTPLLLDDVAPGKHEVTVMSADYLSKTVSARFYKGYKFIAFFELLPRASLGAPKKETFVVLKEKTQGFESPSEKSKVLKHLNKGDSYSLVERSSDGLWYKIKVGEVYVWVDSSLADMK